MPQNHIAIVGAGPAGLCAAEVAAEAGARVTIFDSKPSSGRKFLIAGKSGLNLTNNEPWDTFKEKYLGNHLPTTFWNQILDSFDNHSLRQWAACLGIETFAASSGKIFPKDMKAAPLLRRWIEKLRKLGVTFHFKHELTNIQIAQNTVELEFYHQEDSIKHHFQKVILALGGASWKNTGSTGKWVKTFTEHNIRITPLTAANCGWETAWSKNLLNNAEGLPLKNILISAGKKSITGELVITRYGLEGGPIYKLGSEIKKLPTPKIIIDFKPSHTDQQLISKMESAKRNLIHEAKLRWKLNAATHALVNNHIQEHYPQPDSVTTEQLAKIIKHFPIALTKTRPIDEAISSAGGIQWGELNNNLMLKKLPNVFCAGEMLDWEAPTGGYLLQACFATGTWAGKHASLG